VHFKRWEWGAGGGGKECGWRMDGVDMVDEGDDGGILVYRLCILVRYVSQPCR